MLTAASVSFHVAKRTLLKDINLQFQPGTLYGLLGPNGSGKTTLLKILSGIWQPTEGCVFWQNTNLLARPRREISRLISLVPQSPLIPFDFTAREIVAMGRYPHGQYGRTPGEKDLIDEALNLVDAYSLAPRKMSRLSVGERQRLYIARALVTESPVLLLDEPTASLDVRHEWQIWEIMQKLLLQGKTVIAAIHNLQSVQRYCGEVIVLKDGECRGVGTPQDIMTDNFLSDIYGIPSMQGFTKI